MVTSGADMPVFSAFSPADNDEAAQTTSGSNATQAQGVQPTPSAPEASSETAAATPASTEDAHDLEEPVSLDDVVRLTESQKQLPWLDNALADLQSAAAAGDAALVEQKMKGIRKMALKTAETAATYQALQAALETNPKYVEAWIATLTEQYKKLGGDPSQLNAAPAGAASSDPDDEFADPLATIDDYNIPRGRRQPAEPPSEMSQRLLAAGFSEAEAQEMVTAMQSKSQAQASSTFAAVAEQVQPILAQRMASFAPGFEVTKEQVVAAIQADPAAFEKDFTHAFRAVHMDAIMEHLRTGNTRQAPRVGMPGAVAPSKATLGAVEPYTDPAKFFNGIPM